MKITFVSRITDGVLASKAMSHFLYGAREGESYYVTVTDQKPKRTTAQNNYYHGVVLPFLAIERGETVKGVHRLLGKELLSEDIVVMGIKFRYTRSTADLNVKEMSDYFREIENYFDLLLPSTREYGF